MYGAAPLMDCTRDTLQSMNRHAGIYGSVSAVKPAKVHRHNPYAMKLLAPEDSVEYNISLLGSPMSSRPSPLNWEARAFEPSGLYTDLGTPFVGQSLGSLTMDAQVRRSLFGDSPAALPVPAAEAEAPVDAAAAGAARHPPTPPRSGSTGSPLVGPKRAIGKIYVGGRPVVVPRYDNEVTVQLRNAEASFVIADICALLANEEESREMVGLPVVVEGDRGEDLGTITAVLRAESAAAAPANAAKAEEGKEKGKAEAASAAALPRVLRVATAAELQQYDALPQLEADALAYCHACLSEVQLSVPIVVEGVVFQFDRKKLTVRYTSESYVDFNDLTRLLHKKYNCRIWMDQLNREAVTSGDRRARRGEHGGRRSGNGGNGNQRKGASKRRE